MTDLTKLDVENARYLSRNRRHRVYEVWRKRACVRLPELASRVFALRGTSYLGCGFHYGLESSLGSNIKYISDPTKDIDVLNPMKEMTSRIANQVALKMLFNDVVKAEESAFALEAKRIDDIIAVNFRSFR